MSLSARHRADVRPNSSPLDRIGAQHRKPSTITPRGVVAATASAGVALTGAVAAAPHANASTGLAGGLRAHHGHAAIEKGSYNDDVKRVQEQLWVPATGYYGAKTDAAVKHFQSTIGLRASGVVERRTWSALDYMWAHKGKLQFGKTYKQVLLVQKQREAAKNQARSGGGSLPVTGAFGARVLRYAVQYSGGSYVHGAEGPRNFDCSGYTQFVYRKAGYSLPRTADEQMDSVKHIPKSMAQPGDLVFFTSGGGHAYHAAIYAGGSTVWQSSHPGKPVGKGKIWTSHGLVFGTVR